MEDIAQGIHVTAQPGEKWLLPEKTEPLLFFFLFSLKDYNSKERAHTGAGGKYKDEGAAQNKHPPGPLH